MSTMTTRTGGAVMFSEIKALPMNLLGPDLLRDLVSLIRFAEEDESTKVVVFNSADPTTSSHMST
jgi:enoyl-CoA hydratase/carnithine racemase